MGTLRNRQSWFKVLVRNLRRHVEETEGVQRRTLDASEVLSRGVTEASTAGTPSSSPGVSFFRSFWSPS